MSDQLRSEHDEGVRRVYLITHPRTMSNLLCRMLSQQPGWTKHYYVFKESSNYARQKFDWRPLQDLSALQRREFEELLQSCYDRLHVALQDAQDKQQNFLMKNHVYQQLEPSLLSQAMWGGARATPVELDLHEHGAPVRTNPTLFSDAFLQQWQPVILIRHPGLVFESWYRVESQDKAVDIYDDKWSLYTTFQHSRAMFDWYEARSTGSNAVCQVPIVFDADDMVDNPSVVERLCELCGMDPRKVIYEWDEISESELQKKTQRETTYASDLYFSTGIKPGKSSRDFNPESAHRKWQAAYGSRTADRLKELVQLAMEDYTFLKSKKLTSSDAESSRV